MQFMNLKCVYVCKYNINLSRDCGWKGAIFAITWHMTISFWKANITCALSLNK